MINIVEMCADENYSSPCIHGNIVDGYACYCHSPDTHAPRKCPVWRNYGESDLTKWNSNGDFNMDGWGGGCRYFKSLNN